MAGKFEEEDTDMEMGDDSMTTSTYHDISINPEHNDLKRGLSNDDDEAMGTNAKKVKYTGDANKTEIEEPVKFLREENDIYTATLVMTPEGGSYSELTLKGDSAENNELFESRLNESNSHYPYSYEDPKDDSDHYVSDDVDDLHHEEPDYDMTSTHEVEKMPMPYFPEEQPGVSTPSPSSCAPPSSAMKAILSSLPAQLISSSKTPLALSSGPRTWSQEEQHAFRESLNDLGKKRWDAWGWTIVASGANVTKKFFEEPSEEPEESDYICSTNL